MSSHRVSFAAAPGRHRGADGAPHPMFAPRRGRHRGAGAGWPPLEEGRARHLVGQGRYGRIAVIATAVGAACLLTAGALGVAGQHDAHAQAAHHGAARTHDAAAAAAAGHLQDPAPAPAAAVAQQPVSVSIPSIGVSSPLEHLALDASGALLPPTDFGEAGWYADGATPGEVGSAIIAGHVDSAIGPAVFARLTELHAGDEIDVTRQDGSTLAFEVTTTTQSPKAAFPTADVYGPVPDPELRVITCTGVFDRSTGHYLDNLVVFARLRA